MPVETKTAMSRTDTIATVLLRHYDVHARTLPWRLPPGSSERPNPYRVWLSEIMLQQTTVTAVIPYYEKFTARWPNVKALAEASDADVMAAWAGLGYYARARNLLACARVVAREHGCVFPDSEAALLTLPGVGAYTAAAIAAIAFGRRTVVVDANVERVVSRLFAIETPLPASRPDIRQKADLITPDQRAGDFAQAMMDLGAGTCTVRNPQCLLCPLRGHCEAAQTNRAEDFPVKAPKKDKPHRHGIVWWLERSDGHVWIERRDDKRMLGGMAGLPGTQWDKRGNEAEGAPPMTGDWVALNSPVEHVFTHFRLTLTVERLRAVKEADPEGNGQWWPLARIGKAGLPTLYAKVVKAVMQDRDD